MTEEEKARTCKRERARRLYEERKAKGICVRCGKNKASEKRVTCQECRDKAKIAWMKRKQDAINKYMETHYGRIR